MSETMGFKTKEDFAKSFIPSLKYAIKLAERKAAGETLDNDFEQRLKQLQAEADAMRAEETGGVKFED